MKFKDIPKIITDEKDPAVKLAKVAAGLAVAPIVAPVVGAGMLVERTTPAGRLDIYKPLSVDEYFSDEYNLPNLIRIVDDGDYSSIDVCKGAIGISPDKGKVKCLQLFDEFVEKSGLNFIPAASCGTFYYVDPHNRKNFIKIEDFYEKMQEEKLAELANVATCLGAKYYEAEIITAESQSNNNESSLSRNSKMYNIGASSSQKYEVTHTEKTLKKHFRKEELAGNSTPVKPVLSWFKDTANISDFVEQVCSGNNKSKKVEMYFDTSKSAVMTQAIASSVDTTVKMIDAGVKTDLKAQSEVESSSQIRFKLEF